MDRIFLLLLLAALSFDVLPLPTLLAQIHETPTSHIILLGSVYCDICYDDTFSKHSYFLPGVDVHVECRFKANSPRTSEQIAFSVNRTTDKYGMYQLDIPSVDGVDCADTPAIQSFCRASLIGGSSAACNIPGSKTITSQITVKSKQSNLCIYSMSALSYRPPIRNATLCGNQKVQFTDPFSSSKFFLPYIPPCGIPIPPWPPLPQWPPLPPFPKFPPLPPLPFLPSPAAPRPIPYNTPPSLPFPFPRPPPFATPMPPLLSPPPPPPFNFWDPKTWIPNTPLQPSTPAPPPPTFNLRDPRTWVPYNPLVSSPPPPTFNLGDPKTWIPYNPPTPPLQPQDRHP